MRRRHYLASLPALLAGCLDQSSDNPSSPSPSPTPPTETPPPTATPEPTPEPFACEPTLKRPDASSLTKAEVELVIEDAAPAEIVELTRTEAEPTGLDEIEKYVISQPEPPDEPIVGVVEPTVGTLPGEVEFTLRADGDKQFSFNPVGPSLWKFDGGSWTWIGPYMKQIPGAAIGPGETHTWTFDLESTSSPLWFGRASREHSVGGLGPGVYAFVIQGLLDDPDEIAGTGEGGSLTVMAVFGLAGDPLTIEPEPALVEDDGVIRVAEGESETFRIEPIDEAETSVTLEQVAHAKEVAAGVPYLFCDEQPDTIVVGHLEETQGNAVSYLETVAGSTKVSLLSESFELIDEKHP